MDDVAYSASDKIKMADRELLEMATEDYEERAAIHEHDAGYPRATAESMALRYISEKYGKEVARVIYHGRKS